jgi:hypothetical protein
VVLILELRDGKMWRDRWYLAEPFVAPEWRVQWIERMETLAPGTAPPSHKSLATSYVGKYRCPEIVPVRI